MIDPEELNAIHNRLRGLVGENGVFVLFLSNGKNNLDAAIQIRFVGPDVQLMGTLEGCYAYIHEHLERKFKDKMRRLAAEPD